MLLLMIFQSGAAKDQDRDHEQEKARAADTPRAFQKYYPANAVKADIPFPFGNGRMTAA
jgi:hypothetical protein